jgi:hypothetical protein
MTDCIAHRQESQPEGQRHTEKANAEVRKCRCQNSAAAAAKHQPKRSKEFCKAPISKGHKYVTEAIVDSSDPRVKPFFSALRF